MGKRGSKGTPDSEVEDAIKRMQKRPEHLEAMRDSETWRDFLEDIGVKTAGHDFWDRVREKLVARSEPPEAKPTKYDPIEDFESRGLRRDVIRYKSGRETTVYRDAKGHFAKY